MSLVEPNDRFDAALALGEAGDLLAAFNAAGVVEAADVHVARRLGVLGGEPDERVLLAAALAVRAPRESHVCTDLATPPPVEATSTLVTPAPAEIETLRAGMSVGTSRFGGGVPGWPPLGEWLDAVRASPLVADGDAAPGPAPLRLVGTLLYLDRYWRGERAIAADVLARAAAPVPGVDADRLRDGLARLFVADPRAAAAGRDEHDEPVDLQRLACAVAVLRRFAVIAGGPGTGKTTTVGRLLALLLEQPDGGRPLRIALAAPTGKAAARLEEAVHEQARHLDVDPAVRAAIAGIGASTLHRLLGWRPGSHSRFRHDRSNQLPHDVVIVDETSMVSLSLMAKLVEAVRHDARLVLVGDPDQLASVEAGAVLGDIIGPAATALRMSASGRTAAAAVTGEEVPASDHGGEPGPLGDSIVVLRRGHRFGDAIATLAGSVQRGDADATVEELRAGAAAIRWIEQDPADPAVGAALGSTRDLVVDAGRAVLDAAERGDGVGALDALGRVRVLCAHRRGPYGVATWLTVVERWLRTGIDGYGTGGRWYLGRPVMVTTNDPGLGIYNGDTGVVIRLDGRPQVAFERRGEVLAVSPSRLDALDSVHAMTIHKSQGSQFGTVVVIVPDESSAILTRELLYTAITRARDDLIVVGTEPAVRAAIGRPVARASGLGARLWS